VHLATRAERATGRWNPRATLNNPALPRDMEGVLADRARKGLIQKKRV
jgi:hypothetical protein